MHFFIGLKTNNHQKSKISINYWVTNVHAQINYNSNAADQHVRA